MQKHKTLCFLDKTLQHLMSSSCCVSAFTSQSEMFVPVSSGRVCVQMLECFLQVCFPFSHTLGFPQRTARWCALPSWTVYFFFSSFRSVERSGALGLSGGLTGATHDEGVGYLDLWKCWCRGRKNPNISFISQLCCALQQCCIENFLWWFLNIP